MRTNSNLVKHLLRCEKFLGYEYNPYQDLFCVSHHFDDTEPSTKRSILSEVSTNFNLLSLCPILSCELWKLNLNWDELISDEQLLTWNTLS